MKITSLLKSLNEAYLPSVAVNDITKVISLVFGEKIKAKYKDNKGLGEEYLWEIGNQHFYVTLNTIVSEDTGEVNVLRMTAYINPEAKYDERDYADLVRVLDKEIAKKAGMEIKNRGGSVTKTTMWVVKNLKDIVSDKQLKELLRKVMTL